MICEDPYIKNAAAFPCGKCPPCLRLRKRTWSHRIMLEAMQWSDNAFLTLTYDPKNLPLTQSGLPTLEPLHLQRWLKRFRKELAALEWPGQFGPYCLWPRKTVRFFAVGEYGDESYRPHYHVALFGVRCASGGLERSCKCVVCELVRSTWRLGHTFVGELGIRSAQYISGYVVKKMTRSDDARLEGLCPTCGRRGPLHPEFSRMSLRPGIGQSAMHDVASVMMQLGLDESQSDVPVTLAHGKRELPLGRYLRGELRKMIGREKNAAPYIDPEVQALFESSRVAATPDGRKLTFKNSLIDAGHQRRINSQARADIFKKRSKL